jgi:hypothetical protein
VNEPLPASLEALSSGDMPLSTKREMIRSPKTSHGNEKIRLTNAFKMQLNVYKDYGIKVKPY